MGDIHAVADHEIIRTIEADMIGFHGGGALAALVEKDRDGDAARAALAHEVAGEGERAAGFQNVVDEEDVAAAHIGLDVAHDPHAAGRLGALAIARQSEKLDFGLQPGARQRANEIGREDETALEDGNDDEIPIAGFGDLARECAVTPVDCRRIVEDAQLAATDGRHYWPSAASWRRDVKRSSMSSAAVGGVARRVRKAVLSPAPSVRRAGSTDQA